MNHDGWFIRGSRRRGAGPGRSRLLAGPARHAGRGVGNVSLPARPSRGEPGGKKLRPADLGLLPGAAWRRLRRGTPCSIPCPPRPPPPPPPTHAHALSRSTWGVGVRSCACTLLEDPPTPSAPPVLLPGAPPESGGGPDCLPPPPSTRALAPLRRISCMLWRRWTYTSRRMRPRAGRQRAWRRPWWPSPHRACLRGHPRRRGQVGAGPGVDRGFHLTRGRLRRPCASARASRL